MANWNPPSKGSSIMARYSSGVVKWYFSGNWHGALLDSGHWRGTYVGPGLMHWWALEWYLGGNWHGTSVGTGIYLGTGVRLMGIGACFKWELA